MRLDNMKRVKSVPPMFAAKYGRNKTKLPEHLLIQTVVNAVKSQVLRTLKREGDWDSQPAHERYYTNESAAKIGAKHLGSGNFASVFKHPKLEGKVIKVVLNVEDNYHEYARWCMTQDNIHIPKIHHMEDIGGGRYIFVLDELISIYGMWDIPRDARTVKDVLSHGWCDKEYIEKFGVEISSELTNAMIGLLLLKECNNLRFDLHNGNMMVDKSGNIVITDPVY